MCSISVIIRSVHTLAMFKEFSDEERRAFSEDLKKKFHEAMKGKLDLRTCRDCPSARGFVQTVEFLIDMLVDANIRIDKASQTMENFIALFYEIEEREFKGRMEGGQFYDR